MSIKTAAFIGCSLDGYIARTDGNLNWLFEADNSGLDHGYSEFMKSVDVLVIGRRTFEQVLDFDPWPYPKIKIIVLSKTMKIDEIPEPLRGKIDIHPGPIDELVKMLEVSGCSGIYVDGGRAIQSFIRSELLNEITITTIPILIGEGIPLFGSIQTDIHLKHIKTIVFEDQLVQSVYQFQYK